MTAPGDRSTMWIVMAYLVAAGLHIGLAVWLGNPWPGGLTADENVYLELGQRLWQEGTYGSRASTDYPPLYPMLLAPTFAVSGNAARFAVQHGLNALLLSLACLTLWPMLRDALGRRRGGWALAGMQLLGGAAHTALAVQSEALFVALLTAATGMIYSAVRHPRAVSWLAVGVLTGLALATRRAALALVLGVVLVMVWEGVAAVRQQRRVPWRIGIFALLGAGIGLLPEALAAVLHGGVIEPYDGTAVGSHLTTGVRATASADRLLLLVRVAARHVAYLGLASFAMPALWALNWRGREGEAPPRALVLTAGLVAATGLGMVAMASLHIVRFAFKAGVDKAWDLYPRYVDPLEVALVACGLALGAWWLRGPGGEPGAWRARARAAWPGAVLLASCALVAWTTTRPRSRLPHRLLLEAMGLGDAVPYLFVALVLVVTGVWLAWWVRGRPGGLGTLALVLVCSWGISIHSTCYRIMPRPDAVLAPYVLQTRVLQENPQAPLAILAHRPGRDLYEPLYRSEHPAQLIDPEDLEAWVAQHPDGYVLVRKQAEWPELRLVERARKWLVFDADGDR